jgi:hypothetical protein
MTTPPFLVSVHVPKCAGTSLRLWFHQAYGEERVLADYGDRPIDPSSPMNLDPDGFLAAQRQRAAPAGFRMVHGHVWARKYEHLDAAFVTFLRDPIERALSHYFFWRTLPRGGNRLHDYVLDNALDWRAFVRLPMIRNLYRGAFFRDADMARFAFVGDAGRMPDEMARLGRLLGHDHPIGHVNATAGGYTEDVGAILACRADRELLRDVFADEIAFFERHAG